MQIIIPMISRTPYFPAEEYYFPKPLIEVNGTPMIEVVVNMYRSHFPDAEFIFIVDSEDCSKHSLDKLLKLLVNNRVNIIERKANTLGALCSVMLAVDHLNPLESLIIANSDIFIDTDVNEYISKSQRDELDAAVLTFESLHPRWSYVVTDQNNKITQVYEKDVMSNKAIAGLYFFKNSQEFIRCAMNVILKDVSVNGIFYVSSVLNEYLLENKRLGYYGLSKGAVHSFYSPKSIERYEAIFSQGQSIHAETKIPNIVIPAAGNGSRFFKQGWKKPKPFIDVNGLPMIERVLQNVYQPNVNAHVLLQTSHSEYCSVLSDGSLFQKSNLHFVDKLTEGTACTILKIHEKINNDAPLLVVNSDQLIELDAALLFEDMAERDLDGLIVVFNEPTRDPKWSYAMLDVRNMVTRVAEKEPISNLATVGWYLFRTGKDFVGAAIDMIVDNHRVNNEFYTCPVYNYLITKDKRVGVYVIDKSAMHGLGTPQDLESYLNKKSLPMSEDAPV